MNLYYFIWKSISLKMQACTHTNPHHLWYNEGGSKLPDIKTNPGQRYWSGKSRHPLRQECKTCPSQCPIISPYHQIHRQGIGKLSHSLDWKMHWWKFHTNQRSICETWAYQQEEHNLPMTIQLEKEMNDMCNLSSGIREEGRIEATIQFIKNIMFKRHSSAEEAMELLGIDKAEYPRYLAMLQN